MLKSQYFRLLPPYIYKYSCFFFVLILNPVTLINAFNSNNYFVYFLGLSIQTLLYSMYYVQ